jgi:galactose oxidase
MAAVKLLALSLLLAGSSAAQAITQCPTDEPRWTSPSGKIWAFCNGADYEGPSVSVSQNIANAQTCADLCSKTNDCSKSVYDKNTRACHIKGADNGLRWTANGRFVTSRNIGPITQCPGQETTTTTATGQIFTICPGSDWWGASTQILQNYNSAADCAAQCGKTNGCSKSVYDNSAKACHIKGADNGLTFVADNRFTTARFTGNSGPITQCPGQETTTTTPTGQIFTICGNTDYVGPSTQILQNYNNAADCAALCGKTNGCSKSVYDTTTKSCHVKGPDNQLTWKVDSRFITSRLTGNATPNGQIITQCPTQETTTKLASGQTFATCGSTDYEGPSTQIVPNYNNVADCVSLCDRTNGCVKIVYDTQSRDCHIKGPDNGLVWKTNTRFISARRTAAGNTPANGVAITQCPTQETTYTAPNGFVYKTCAGSDYQGPTVRVYPNYANAADCAKLCGATSPCDKSVFDSSNGDCHLKASDTYGLQWTANTRFISTRRVDVGNVGKWGPLITFPIIPVAAAVVPSDPSRLLLWSAWGANNFGGDPGFTQFADYNWKTGAMSQRQVANTQHDMFCPGISTLTDGRVIITGGSSAAVASIFSPANNGFSRAPNMKIARGYQSSATLSDGKVFTIGGSYSGGIATKNGEVYDPSSNSWTLLNGAKANNLLTTYDAEGAWRTDNHAWLYSWRDGTVFQAGPSKQMNWYGTSDQGSVQGAGIRDSANDAMCGANVMYDTGKIFAAGGSQSYTNSDAFTRVFLITIGQPFQTPTVERAPDMRYARGFGDAIALPDGKVLMVGGQKRSLVFTDTDSALAAELFDPATKTWKVLAEMKIPRNYHSVALLLADGTVFSGGGGLCSSGYGNSDAWCNRAVDHADAQIFSPPYLFNDDGTAATRPTINSVSSQTVRPGGRLTANMGDSNAYTFSFVRMGTSTHSINTDQRRISLNTVSQSGSSYTITLPNDYGVLIPGYWYLFALNKAGTPSIASIVQVK